MSGLAGLVYPINALPAVRLGRWGIAELCHDADAKTEAVRRYYGQVDADLLFFFSDIVIQAEALGAELAYSDASMPRVRERSASLPERPGVTARMDVNARVTASLKRDFPGKLVAGMVYGPFTVAGQAVGEEALMRSCLTDPVAARQAVATALEGALVYARLLLDAGADVLWISDPFAGLLPPRLFGEFAGDALRILFDAFPLTMNALHICGDVTQLVPAILDTGVEAISFDQVMNMAVIEDAVPPGRVLIGNLDPLEVADAQAPDAVREATASLVQVMGTHPCFSLSTGCALPPSTPVENAAAFVDEGRHRMRAAAPHAALLHALSSATGQGDRQDVPGLVDVCLCSDIEPLDVLGSGLMRAVRKASGLYDAGKIHLADILLLTDALNAGMKVLGPLLPKTGDDTPRMVIGTASGDHHAIGKDVVRAVLEAQGVRVLDLGVDVNAEAFAEALNATKATLAGISAFTSHARSALKSMVPAIRSRTGHEVGIVIGGAASSAAWAGTVGADGFAKDAAAAVKLVKSLLARPCTSM